MSETRLERHFVSYPKSGRSWIRYIINDLGLADDVVFHHDQFEFNDGAMPPHDLDLDARMVRYANVEKLAYLTRDPRDVMVSLFHQITGRFGDIFDFTGTFSEFIRDDYFGAHNLQAFLTMWDTLVERRRFLKVSYEECHADTFEMMRKILAYYELECPGERLMESVEKGSFPRMKALEVEMTFPQPWLRLRNGFPKMRIGKIGALRDTISTADLEFLERVFDLPR